MTSKADILAESATKVDAKLFLQLINKVTTQLSTENRLGVLQITGKLVRVPSVGEAVIVGDLHGDLKSLVQILKTSNFMEKINSEANAFLIFLGDYGDRGVKSPEVYYVILRLKEMFPENVILVKGNHEGPADLLVSPHELPQYLENKFGEKGSEVYSNLRELFNQLYTGVLIDQRCILLHGGVPSQATIIDDIAYAHKKHPQELLLEEILWNDPLNGLKGTIASPRGAGRLFGEDITKKFLRMLNVKALIRGHQSCQEGYKTDHNQNVLTLFSRKGTPYNNQYGAYLHLDLSKKIEKPNQLLKGIHKF